MPAVAAAEPVEDAPEHFRRDALAGVRDDHVDRQAIPGRSDGQLYDIAVTSVPDGVLQQRVDREAETLPVGLHGDLVQPAELRGDRRWAATGAGSPR